MLKVLDSLYVTCGGACRKYWLFIKGFKCPPRCWLSSAHAKPRYFCCRRGGRKHGLYETNKQADRGCQANVTVLSAALTDPSFLRIVTPPPANHDIRVPQAALLL